MAGSGAAAIAAGTASPSIKSASTGTSYDGAGAPVVIPIKFALCDNVSTIYREMTRLLRHEFGAKRMKGTSTRLDLLLGDRNNPPYFRMGMMAATHGGLPPLINFYRGNDRLCQKAKMAQLLQGGTAAARPTWLPETYTVRGQRTEQPDHERDLLLLAHAQRPRVWIAKPTCGCKGENILIDDNLPRLLQAMDHYRFLFVVTEYLLEPLLLTPGGRKFDLRLWVLLDPQYEAFIFEEGVLRTASTPYTADSWDDVTQHLTNHAIQEVHAQDYERYEPGNELFFPDFRLWLQEHRGVDFDEEVMPQMAQIIHQCFDALRPSCQLPPGHAYHSFQLFGFDFMLDAAMKVWLIEVNGAPAAAARLTTPIAHDLCLHVAQYFGFVRHPKTRFKPVLDLM
ncbi:uncharacterized protein MONBRDRAFT_14687 [Monosiga brevicollis MX1]|uniref:Tubulin--tyrosine ligase n=1 Tax=Monosiga brevicollis TaxID=81824 RepID=A9URJ2_MONBE|nr:uncharacterized protein MONBRDRAFT_14687 [Monosiga brevicollis MX1]EDQ92253.1 predicted protein [Monosiga brevicollis MX1]|eukprot:XP_001743539.1 hypothetical protein [Monosiga brevicollis MX1]